MNPYTYSQIYSFAEYLSNGLLVYALIWPLIYAFGLHNDPGRTDRSIPIRFSAYTADLARVELVRSTLPLKLNLRFRLLFGFFVPASSFCCTPMSIFGFFS